MSSTRLHDFVERVPLWVSTVPWGALLEIAQSTPCELLCAVDQEQRPLGVLRTVDVLQQGLRQQWLSQEAEEGCHGTAAIQETSVLPQLLPLNHLLEPAFLLPVDLTPEQGWIKLEKQPQSHWIVTDSAGRCLGLLNTQRLLQFLARQKLKSTTQLEHVKAIDPENQPGSLEQQPPEPRHDPYSLALQLFVQLLEPLPFPLMLQTSRGHVIRQNPAWQRRVSPLVNLTQLRQDAVAVLKRMNLASGGSDATESREDVQGPEHPEAPGQFVPATGAYFCVVPKGHESEQVVQFRLISLGKLATNPDLNPPLTLSPALEETSRLSEEVDFCLAPLKVNQSGSPTLQTENAHSDPMRSLSNFAQRDLWLVLLEDLTEQRQLQKELALKTANLAQLNQLKTEFLNTISHELKTPLTAILGLSDLLQRQIFGKLSDRQADYAQLIYHSSRQLMHIVNSIVDLTRVETGQLELSLESVSIATVCNQAVQQAQQLQFAWAGLRGHEPHARATPSPSDSSSKAGSGFTLEIESDLQQFVADPLRLRQMLTHLLWNAFKFTQPPGQVGLRVNRWESWIAFTVWDAGIGIPVEQQHLIFQKYQHVENLQVQGLEGVGLGLALTQRLARLHGGEISFWSDAGKGSEFILLLPLNPSLPPKLQRHHRHEADQVRSPDFSDTTATPDNALVLIVARNPELTATVIQKLKALGYWAVIARSGSEALDKAQQLEPRIILLHAEMTTIPGWGILSLLKSDPEVQRIPIVVMATASDQDRAEQYGADGYLGLPLQKGSLQHYLTDRTNCLEKPAFRRLTVLCLGNMGEVTRTSREGQVSGQSSAPSQQPEQVTTEVSLSSLLHFHHHRVLEAVDLEQAELLAQIWQPDVMVLNCQTEVPLAYLQQLSKHSVLATLPLVTLNAAVAQAARQLPTLRVFPCLEPLPNRLPSSSPPSKPPLLLQILQVATTSSR